MRPILIAAAVLALLTLPTWAQDGSAGQTAAPAAAAPSLQRFLAPDEAPPVIGDTPGPEIGLSAMPLAPDISLTAPTSQTRLPTPVDTLDIDQRIDKGLTAAGEESVFPPDYAYGAFQRGHFLTAFSLALERAEAGDAAAQTLLGELLSRGLGVKQDLSAAADWYRLAGQAGDAEALYALGRFYLEGMGAEKDPTKAADLFEQAARSGHPVAAREFAYLLLQGQGRERNAMLAAAYLRRAAGRGDMDAQHALAGLYSEGVGVVSDEAQAARWYGEAARNGHIGAEIEYAIMLFNGRGIAKNEAVAARWFLEAANADNPVAQVRLARILAEGRGMDKNPAEAARWYLIARSHGLQDDHLDGWMNRLEEPIRKAAEEAAGRWTAARRGAAQAAAQPSEAGKQIDKAIQ